MAKRFVIWAAVSSEEQAERYSLTEQIELAQQHVERWQGDVVDVLTVDESRSIVLFEDACRRIPAYARLRQALDARTFDVLICYDTTRLGRKRSLIMTILELCAETGITVYEMDNAPATLDGAQSFDRRILDAIKSTSAQQEIDKLKARFTYGRIGRIKAGRMPGRTPPYGYTYVYETPTKRTVAINDEQAAIVLEIIDRYLGGAGADSIAVELNRRGVPAPAGGAWGKDSAQKILSRVHAYAGWSQSKVKGHGIVRARGDWTPIITEATAERVTNERAARAANRRMADSRSRLTGVVWCEQCNKPMRQVINDGDAILDYYDKRRKSPRVRRAVFYCVPYHAGGSVGTKLVLEAIRAGIDVLAGADLSQVDDDRSQVDMLTARIATHAAAIDRHHAALKRADTAFVSGVMDEQRYIDQVQRLRAAIDAEQGSIDKLHAAIADEQSRGSRRDRIAEIIAHGYKWLDDPDTANAQLRARVRVWVAGNSITNVDFL